MTVLRKSRWTIAIFMAKWGKLVPIDHTKAKTGEKKAVNYRLFYLYMIGHIQPAFPAVCKIFSAFSDEGLIHRFCYVLENFSLFFWWGLVCYFPASWKFPILQTMSSFLLKIPNRVIHCFKQVAGNKFLFLVTVTNVHFMTGLFFKHGEVWILYFIFLKF